MATKKSPIKPLPLEYISERYLDLLFETGILNELELSILKPLSLEGKTIPDIAKSLDKQNWLVRKTAKSARLKVVNAFQLLQTSVKEMDKILIENQRLLAEVKYARLIFKYESTSAFASFLSTPIKELNFAKHGVSEITKNGMLRRVGSDALIVDALEYSEKEWLKTRGVGKKSTAEIKVFFLRNGVTFAE